MEWVVKEDARRILLSSPPGAVCERSISSCHFGATARGRALGLESPLLSLPVRDASRRRQPLRRRADGTRPGAGVWCPPPSRSQSGMRVGDDVRRDDGATAQGRALGMESPLLSLPVRDASRGLRPPRRWGDGTRPGAGVWFPPPRAPSQGCEWGTTSAGTTERRHEAGC